MSSLAAQQLLDRIVAHVDGRAITLTDVRAALALGLVEVPEGSNREPAAAQRLIERLLVLSEVARFSPPDPPAADVDREVARMTARAGGRLDTVMDTTGVDEVRIREMARDTLRIEAYLNQRFGTTVQVSTDEVALYYKTHPEEFTRNGVLMPFAEAEPQARTRAAAERRASTITQWMRDLRARANVLMRN